MDRSIISKDSIEKMISRHIYNDQIIYFSYLSTCAKFKGSLPKLFAIMNKYYPSFTYLSNSKEIPWEDIFITEIELPIGKGSGFLEFNIPVYYELDGELVESRIHKNGMVINFEINHDNKELVLLSIIPNAYTNLNFINSYTEKEGWQKIQVNQENAAKENRNRLKLFLKDIEQELGKANNYGSNFIDPKYLYEYGIKDSAVLKNLTS